MAEETQAEILTRLNKNMEPIPLSIVVEDLGLFQSEMTEAEREVALNENMEAEQELAAELAEDAANYNDLPPTAAGADIQGQGNEGHSQVSVEYLAPEADVTSGFDTTGISVAFQEKVDEYGESIRLDELSQNDAAEQELAEKHIHQEDAQEETENEPEDSGEGEQPHNQPDLPQEEEPETEDPVDDDPEGEDLDDELDDDDVFTEDDDLFPKEHQDNGFGNGDDDAPGRSEDHNNAENAGGNHDGTISSPGNSNHALDVPQPHVDLS